jgi:uncharacterized protein (UPF0335 family)
VVSGEVGGNAAQSKLVGYVERIENLIEQRKGINDDIKDVKAEAKIDGFDPSIIMEAIRVRAARAKSPAKYQERKELLDTYLAAFGIDDD